MAVVRTFPVFFLILTATGAPSAQEMLPPGAGMIVSQHQSPAQWSEIINQMVRNGAEVTPADAATITAYLAESFGATHAPVAAKSR